jgi:hypothetical protein
VLATTQQKRGDFNDSAFLTQLGTDLQNVAIALGVNISNIMSHLASFLSGTV